MLLPAPLGPISATISPAATAKLTLLTATSPPNRRSTSCTRSRGEPGAGFARTGSGGAGPGRSPLTRGSTRRTAGTMPPRARCRKMMKIAANTTISNGPDASLAISGR